MLAAAVSRLPRFMGDQTEPAGLQPAEVPETCFGWKWLYHKASKSAFREASGAASPLSADCSSRYSAVSAALRFTATPCHSAILPVFRRLKGHRIMVAFLLQGPTCDNINVCFLKYSATG